MKKISWILIIVCQFLTQSLIAQQVSVELGPDKIALNQAFTITLTIQNERLQNYTLFPEIEGFVKRGTSTSSSSQYSNGQWQSSSSIIQNYVATNEGQFRLKTFNIAINGHEVTVEGKIITVGPALQQQRQRRNDPFSQDPFQDMFGRQNNGPQEFIEVEADAFLALTSDKNSVYPGEGFTLTLAFYISEKNQAQMSFYRLREQLPDIIKKIKPVNCWEENFNIETIEGEPINLNGQKYSQFKMYQATFYPLNRETINIPKVGMDFIKYKVAKNPSFFGRNKQEDVTNFQTKPKQITVKDLPPHPLKESVSVGVYQLEEKISHKELNTGESFNYVFGIVGEGNISAIKDLEIKGDENFDIYPPTINQDIRRGNGKVRGKKIFSYYGIPNEPGEYDLSKYFNWIFFNTNTGKYDTLKSEVKMIVNGESKKNENILSSDLGSFYDSIDLQDNSFFSLNEKQTARTIINIIIFALLGGVVILIFKK